MKVVFSNDAYAALLLETQEKIKTETGGVFLGSFKDDTWYIIETIDPGPKSVFRVDYFEYDQPYTAHLINKRARFYKAPLTLVGLWHRHPGSFDVFSTTDDGTNIKYAGISSNGAVSMLVNIDPVFRLSVFYVDTHSSGRPRYTLLNYEVGDDKIPHELMEKKDILSLQSSIDNSGIRSMGLRKYIGYVTEQLEQVPELDEDSESNLVFLNRAAIEEDHQKLRDRLIDLVLDDVSYLSDQIGFRISVSWKEDTMVINEKSGGEFLPVFSFSYLLNYDRACIELDGNRYFTCDDMFRSERLRIPPEGTFRESGCSIQNRSSVTTVDASENDIEQIYKNIRTTLYRFFSKLLENSDGKE